MNDKPSIQLPARFSTQLARDLFGLGAEYGLALKKQVEDQRNIAAAKQAELTTEGRTYPQRHDRDE